MAVSEAMPPPAELPGRLVAGTDEAGRGALAGDVVAAAVILGASPVIPGLDDSKKLSPAQRERCATRIRERALVWAIGRASPGEIDSINILAASLLAMRRAVEALGLTPQLVLVDGNHCPRWQYPARAIVGGDGRVAAIAAASVLAKTVRDEEMRQLDELYPGYGFARHKGYPTAAHRAALARHGPCPAHRRSYAPVARLS